MASRAKVLALASQQTEQEVAAEQETLDANSLLRNANDEIKACEHNARILLRDAVAFADVYFDAFLYRQRQGSRDWTDTDDVQALCWLQATHRVAGFKLWHVHSAMKLVAHERERDSLKEFVNSLPAWDGTPRIDKAFADAWGASDDAVTRASSRNFLIALLARAIDPGAQVDSVWCFEGHQGTYKSRSLRALGRDYHAEITAPIGTADFMRELRGLWIAELSELDSLRAKEASTVKRLLSAPSDRFVEKYDRYAQTYLRRAVAVATTNEADYWQDPTGARRLIPVRCGEIRVDLIENNRLQWFAEALVSNRAGSTWWTFPDGIAEAQDERQSVDPWEDAIRDYMVHGRRAGTDGNGREPWPDGWISSTEIMRDWLRLESHQQGRASGVRIGHVMRRLGYEPARFGHHRERGWRPADAHAPDDDDVSASVSAHFPL